MIDKDFLAMLVCPSSRQPLREATAAELAGLNAKVAAGALKNRGGNPVQNPIAAGLVPSGPAPSGGAVLYPIVDGIPILLTSEAVPLA